MRYRQIMSIRFSEYFMTGHAINPQYNHMRKVFVYFFKSASKFCFAEGNLHYLDEISKI